MAKLVERLPGKQEGMGSTFFSMKIEEGSQVCCFASPPKSNFTLCMYMYALPFPHILQGFNLVKI